MKKRHPKGSEEAEETRTTTIRLPKALLIAAKVYAAEHETTLNELIFQGLVLIVQSDMFVSPKPIANRGV
jgi:NRPS condensation-like uncharacterized protein